MTADGTSTQEPEAGVAAVPVLDEQEVLCDGERWDHPVAHALFRDISQPRRPCVSRVRSRQLGVAQSDGAAQRRSKPCNRLGELPLPVARDPGDTDDLTGGNLERQPPNGFDPAVAPDTEVPDPDPSASLLG